MSIYRLKFQNEEDRRIARDIHLDVLERRGWKPGPVLEMLVREEDATEIQSRLQDSGVHFDVQEEQ